MYDESEDIVVWTTGNSAEDVGVWIFVAATYDGTSGTTAMNGVTLYVNGVVISSTANNNAGYVAIENTASVVDVGMYDTEKWFNGKIDEVMLYKRALAPEEIRTHYLRGSGFGASGAITADKFRVVNTSGSRTMELNGTAFEVLDNAGGDAFVVDKVNSRVGIGTTTPDSLLEISAGTSGSAYLTIEADTDNNDESDITGINFSQDGGALRAYLDWGGPNNDYFQIRTIHDNTDINISAEAYPNAILIDSSANEIELSGNVGIGTNSPSGRLDIEGGELTLDTDADTSITADTDDRIDFEIGGADVLQLDLNSLLLTTSGNAADFTQTAYRANTGQTSLLGRFARGTSGSPGVVIDGDLLMEVKALGMDANSGTFRDAASINFEVDGTPGSSDMPGRIVFSTTLNGASSATERMRITNAGNVGIGTTSPATKLVVEGTSPPLVNISAGASTSVPPANNLLFVEDNTDANIAVVAAGASTACVYVGEGNDPDKGGICHLGGTTGDPLAIRRGSANVIHIINNRMTIGSQSETSPDATLELVDSGDPIFMISNGASGDGDFMIVDTSGNVGIGTTAPQYILQTDTVTAGKDVNLSNVLFVNSSNESVKISGTSTGNPFYGLIINNRDSSANTGGGIEFQTGDKERARIGVDDEGAGGMDIFFQTQLSSVMYERMRIGGDGNVGIGTTDPDNELDLKSGGIASDIFTIERSGGTDKIVTFRETSTGDAYVTFDQSDGTFRWLFKWK